MQGLVVTTWYGDDSLHLSLPNSQPLSVAVRGGARVTGKAGGNGQNSGGWQLTLDRRLPEVVTHSRSWRALCRFVETRITSGVSIDWVTRSYSLERRRLNVQSGLRRDSRRKSPEKGPSVAARDRGH